MDVHLTKSVLWFTQPGFILIHITIIITVSLISSHLISSAIRPSIVQQCLRISLHRVFTLAWLPFKGTLNLFTHLRYYYLISSPHMQIFIVTLISFCEVIVIVIVKSD